MVDLSGRVALVTGVASQHGIGRSIAVRLAHAGADLALVDLPVPVQRMPEGWRGLGSVLEEIEGLGRRGLTINADLSQSDDIEEVVRSTLAKFGHIDILVNNAGVRMNPNNIPAIEIEEADWERVLRCNLTAPFLLSKAVAKAMIERGEGGKIVNIASVAGKRPLAGMAAYSTSKAALISLTGLMALELAKYRIRVNAVCPGGVETDASAVYRDSAARAAAGSLSAGDLLGKPALGRRGSPDEIANVVAFLASDESSYIDGQAINVCGAWVLER